MWPNETEAISLASDRRAEEFAAGRHCARRALDLLGYPPVGIPRLPTNAPGWPASISGSLSHSAGYCGAVVAWRNDFGAIGFDVERRESVSPSVLAEIASGVEIARLRRRSRDSIGDLATVLFSAKESYYKAHHQAYGSELDFLDVDFRILGASAFEITHRQWSAGTAEQLAPRTGRFLIGSSHVFTAMAWRIARNDSARADL